MQLEVLSRDPRCILCHLLQAVRSEVSSCASAQGGVLQGADLGPDTRPLRLFGRRILSLLGDAGPQILLLSEDF